MWRRGIWSTSSLLSLLILASPSPLWAAEELPEDVADFIEQRELCDHFRGEEPTSKEREEELKKGLEESCRGTDRKLAGLKQKYRASERILTLLGSYEPGIESDFDPCAELLPSSLSAMLQARYEDWRLVTRFMLMPSDLDLYERDHGASCPGAVRLDFYGKPARQYGVVLMSDASGRRQACLLVAEESAKDRWRIREIERIDSEATPVVYSMPPGRHQGFREEQPRLLTARHEALILAWYEKVAVLYAWNGSRVEELWISD